MALTQAVVALLHDVCAALRCKRGLVDGFNLHAEHLGRRRTAVRVVRLLTTGERVQHGHGLRSVRDVNFRLNKNAPRCDTERHILQRGVEQLRQLGRVGELVKLLHGPCDRGVEGDDTHIDHRDGRIEVVNVEVDLLQRHLVRGVGPHEAEPELGARAEGQVDLGKAATGTVAVLVLVGVKVRVTLRDLNQQIERDPAQIPDGAVAQVGLARVWAVPAEVAVQNRAAAQVDRERVDQAGERRRRGVGRRCRCRRGVRRRQRGRRQVGRQWAWRRWRRRVLVIVSLNNDLPLNAVAFKYWEK